MLAKSVAELKNQGPPVAAPSSSGIDEESLRLINDRLSKLEQDLQML